MSSIDDCFDTKSESLLTYFALYIVRCWFILFWYMEQISLLRWALLEKLKCSKSYCWTCHKNNSYCYQVIRCNMRVQMIIFILITEQVLLLNIFFSTPCFPQETMCCHVYCLYKNLSSRIIRYQSKDNLTKHSFYVTIGNSFSIKI